jgi:hypothetical protein
MVGAEQPFAQRDRSTKQCLSMHISSTHVLKSAQVVIQNGKEERIGILVFHLAQCATIHPFGSRIFAGFFVQLP